MQKTIGCVPVFHDENIFYHFCDEKLPFDEQGLYRPLEMMLLPESNLKVLEVKENGVLKVRTDKLEKGYVFKDSLEFSMKYDRVDLKEKNILDNLLSYVGCSYIWGSNWTLSKNQQEALQVHLKTRSENFIKNMQFLFSGLDCSGLLYASAQGQVPRNTSELVHFGKFIEVEGLSNLQICEKVRPLDLIVWKGHVLVFLDEKSVIESRKDYGCVVIEAQARLEEIRSSRDPANVLGENKFYIKRWYSGS